MTIPLRRTLHQSLEKGVADIYRGRRVEGVRENHQFRKALATAIEYVVFREPWADKKVAGGRWPVGEDNSRIRAKVGTIGKD